ncbi:unnamed protein product [Caenorhabditis sp. 36 PRJEB53466]|nr:unnamed protein product [Caenorhabditis sp. 36 PRJEB53466]
MTSRFSVAILGGVGAGKQKLAQKLPKQFSRLQNQKIDIFPLKTMEKQGGEEMNVDYKVYIDRPLDELLENYVNSLPIRKLCDKAELAKSMETFRKFHRNTVFPMRCSADFYVTNLEDEDRIHQLAQDILKKHKKSLTHVNIFVGNMPFITTVIRGPHENSGECVIKSERELAERPNRLAPWKFEPQRAQKTQYDPKSFSCAFNKYIDRLSAKKLAPMSQKTARRRVTFDETIIGNENSHLFTNNRRSDEINIETFSKKTTISMDSEDVVEVPKVPKDPNATPGFYGTVEAEKCSEQVAAHLFVASRHLQRLKFMSAAVFPATSMQLRSVEEMNNDIKDFNGQLKTRRVKVPTPTAPTRIAHFVMTEQRSFD